MHTPRPAREPESGEDPPGPTSGGRGAFEALHHSTFVELCRFCQRCGVPEGSAEDVVSEAFLALWRRWDSVPATLDARRAWLFEAVRRISLDHTSREIDHRVALRRVARLELVAPAQLPDEGLLSREQVQGILARLPAEQAEALRLTVIEGYTAREAGELLRIPASTITTRVARARATLEGTQTPSLRRGRQETRGDHEQGHAGAGHEGRHALVVEQEDPER